MLIRGVLYNITISKRVQQGTDTLNRLGHTEIESFVIQFLYPSALECTVKKCASLR